MNKPRNTLFNIEVGQSTNGIVSSHAFALTNSLSFQVIYLYPTNYLGNEEFGYGHEEFMRTRKDGAATMRKSDDPTDPAYDEIVLFPKVPTGTKGFKTLALDLAKEYFTYVKAAKGKPAHISAVLQDLSYDLLDGLLEQAYSGKIPVEVQRVMKARRPKIAKGKAAKAKGTTVADMIAANAAAFTLAGSTKKGGKARKVS